MTPVGIIVVVPYVLRIGGVLIFLLAAWSSLDWVHRAAGAGHTPAVVAGVVAGIVAVVGIAWFISQFRGAQARRDWRRISLLIVVGVAAILAFASTGALLTGYEGAGGGGGIWPPLLRGGEFGVWYFYFAATVYSGLALFLLISLIRRALARPRRRPES